MTRTKISKNYNTHKVCEEIKSNYLIEKLDFVQSKFDLISKVDFDCTDFIA